ncbi:DnaD domain-containing protein [Lacticaseibacillus casei 12A]|uniref:Lin1244/Lin1753 domain-containing protein n=1 Tax=Lacticaseibacillus paracasei TaxID=1597 RepID=UPI0002976123|nr:Lin1244/Lin1753 domain-containing protein [Lacticaseibacillus paracasei]EKP98159.1 DnaD domain-containing protein [Lacticaseibacillus casei 12A]
MARPLKHGVDYFPWDVDSLRDMKVRKILRANGASSIAVLICLLGNIYGDEGYYMLWDEDARFLIADDVGVKESYVQAVVEKSTQVGFFDSEIFSGLKILTSRGIQKRYQNITGKRKENELRKDIDLINGVSDVSNPVIGADNFSSNRVSGVDNPQSKVKESKVNKTKRQQTTDPVKAAERPAEEPSSSSSSILDICNFWEGNGFGQLSPFTRENLVDWVDDMRKAGSPEPEKLVLNALRTAVESNVRNYNYVNGILKNWESKRLLTVAAVDANDNERKTNQPQQRYVKPVRNEKLPDWAEPGYKPEHKKASAEDRAKLAEQLQKLRALGEKN